MKFKKEIKGFASIPKLKKELDKVFSKYIRERDKKCVRCGKTTGLTCSHFWSRKHLATRYDEDNCDALCFPCHLFHWEKEKQGAYLDYMKRKLGVQRYDVLEYKAHSITKLVKGDYEYLLRYYIEELKRITKRF
jgi:hypothetical protein